jgi:CrcB protein
LLHSAGIYFYVAIGGAIGACLRYGLSQLALSLFGKGFPVGTLFVNILGSLLIGLLYGVIEQGLIELQLWRTVLGIGFLGALTTFSTFSMDTLLLMQQGAWIKACLNVLLNVFVCLMAVWIGSKIAIIIKN